MAMEPISQDPATQAQVAGIIALRDQAAARTVRVDLTNGLHVMVTPEFWSVDHDIAQFNGAAYEDLSPAERDVLKDLIARRVRLVTLGHMSDPIGRAS